MSVQRYTKGGQVRYRARIKSHGREVATRVFDRKADAVAWEQDQTRKLRLGEWTDPKRGRVPLSAVAEDWLESRSSAKRRTREADEADWRLHIAPRFGNFPLVSITAAEVSSWVGSQIAAGRRPSSVTRYLATLRSILNYAIADGRITVNVAALAKAPSGGQSRREGVHLTEAQLYQLADACNGRYAELVLVLGLGGLRWGEMAGLQAGDRVWVPGRGLRLQRAVLASGGSGELFVDTLKSKRARTVPLVDELIPLVDRWAGEKVNDAWLFHAPQGGPLSEGNWKRSVRWSAAIKAIGVPTLRVHDLRHTAASVWLGSGADPKVVQRILGHASAAMTMDLYGHLIDQNLWDAARKIGGTTGTRRELEAGMTKPPVEESGL
ncbi:site-specific recombinase XerD [Kribbella voronezhensis]|uniref:Site-specific recombinase XerD n=1 Tax=Kribbella voronezhensis TaxID=2512212 RepID=A0A4R7TE26_9ACTN|nr:site-specific integrase [Kribbella voronezhensis]TDU90400.1 site-specific recombinase XerD [Kribbella voronezhensis]